jgi:hypothetical protein
LNILIAVLSDYKICVTVLHVAIDLHLLSSIY